MPLLQQRFWLPRLSEGSLLCILKSLSTFPHSMYHMINNHFWDYLIMTCLHRWIINSIRVATMFNFVMAVFSGLQNNAQYIVVVHKMSNEGADFILVTCSVSQPFWWEGKGQGTTFKKSDVGQGRDSNWLEQNRSKMADELTSTRPWASAYTHSDTSAS